MEDGWSLQSKHNHQNRPCKVAVWRTGIYIFIYIYIHMCDCICICIIYIYMCVCVHIHAHDFNYFGNITRLYNGVNTFDRFPADSRAFSQDFDKIWSVKPQICTKESGKFWMVKLAHLIYPNIIYTLYAFMYAFVCIFFTFIIYIHLFTFIYMYIFLYTFI